MCPLWVPEHRGVPTRVDGDEADARREARARPAPGKTRFHRRRSPVRAAGNSFPDEEVLLAEAEWCHSLSRPPQMLFRATSVLAATVALLGSSEVTCPSDLYARVQSRLSGLPRICASNLLWPLEHTTFGVLVGRS